MTPRPLKITEKAQSNTNTASDTRLTRAKKKGILNEDNNKESQQSKGLNWFQEVEVLVLGVELLLLEYLVIQEKLMVEVEVPNLKDAGGEPNPNIYCSREH